MKKELFNRGWFFSSDIDSTRREVNLPHDAMQTEKRIPALKDGPQTAFYPGGTYTYEKELIVAEEDLDKKTLLEFEGIYMKSSVSLNGERLGGRIYGYSDFYVDLTGKLKLGSNKIQVVADNSQCANSRWYSGSGIYRDVWLHTAGKEYILPDGLRVTTVSVSPARLGIHTEAVKDDNTDIRITVSKDGIPVVEGSGADLTLDIPDAKLWSADSPELYEVRAGLVRDGKVLDAVTEQVGIRTITLDAVRGLQINGKTVKLRGGCVHHDHAFIGAAEYDAACLRRIRIMKDAGFNAVRISHNPASKAMLRACDALGMYVMNETFDTWLGLKSPYDYAMYFEQEWEKDLSDMIRISYNHPSVVLYSIGNEVYLKDVKVAAEISRKMTAVCKKLDSSRPVTNALNPLMVIMGNSKNPEAKQADQVDPRAAGEASGLTGSGLANVLISNMDKLMLVVANERKMRKINAALEPLDVVGFNYGTYLYAAQHKDYPNRVLVGSETFPAAIHDNWLHVKTKPYLIGDFLWTAWDYLGECGVGSVHYGKQGSFTQPFPTISAGCANIDLSGEILPQGYYTSVVYGEYKKPYLAVHPVTHSGEKAFTGKWRLTDAVHTWDWSGCEGKTATVDVYSGAASVELFLNGKTFGKKPVVDCKAVFDVPYAPGELKAIQYDAQGRETGCDTLSSTGNETKLSLSPEKETLFAGGMDLLFLPIELVDENGVRRFHDDREISVKVEGAAELIGLGSGDLAQEGLMPYVGTDIRSFQGRALAILRSKEEAGEIKVVVSADGLTDASVTLRSL